MNQPPLNPDALRRAADAVSELYADGHCPKAEDAAEVAVSAYLAAALPEVTSVEELVTTRAGLALANTAFGEGLSAGIRACNASGPDRPFKKPVSPYSAPLLAMIKADRPEVNDA